MLAAVAFGGLAAAAVAQEEEGGLRGWDGSNPFDCVIQQVGQGTDFPDPDADPFCVEYDKTRQNVTDLGVVEFLSQEPARVAAASPKCFYYQRDSWRGSIVQGNQATETYRFDGRYYFDKAIGAGGVYVENFRIAGQSGDPTVVPGFPEEYKPFFGEGRGGFQGNAGVQADPRCAAAAEEDRGGGEDDRAGGRGADDDGGEGPGDDDAEAARAGTDPGFAEGRGDPSFAG